MATLRPWWPLRLRQAQSVDERRWVILDVETSGLDPAKDALLAVAAVAMRVDWAGKRLCMDAGDSLELVLRPDAVSSRGNILLHGIGAHMQQTGLEPDAALQTFVAFVGAAPLLAFHSAFDQAVLDRYCQRHLGKACSNPWLDIAHLCAATHPDVHARSLMNGWRISASPARCATRRLPMPGRKANCCSASGRAWCPNARPGATSAAWRSATVGCPGGDPGRVQGMIFHRCAHCRQRTTTSPERRSCASSVRRP